MQLVAYYEFRRLVCDVGGHLSINQRSVICRRSHFYSIMVTGSLLGGPPVVLSKP